MKKLLALAPLVAGLSMSLAACEGTTVLGGADTDQQADRAGGSSSSSGSGSASSSSGSGHATTGTAIAMRYGDLPSDVPAVDDPAEPIDPAPTPLAADSLLFLWSNVEESCSEGYVSAASGRVVWQAALSVPASLAQVGTVDLSATGIYSFLYEYDLDSGVTSDLANYVTGTMEIVAMDGLSITVNLVTPIVGAQANTMWGSLASGVTLQGTYTFVRC